MQPKLDDHGVDSETDPERDPEELIRAKMRAGTGGEEHSHDGASGCDTEQDTHSAGHPLALSCPLAAKAQPVGTAQRQQEPRGEDEDRGSLDPAADDRVSAHCVCRRAGDGAEGKEKPLQPVTAGTPQQDASGEHHEDCRRDDVHRG